MTTIVVVRKGDAAVIAADSLTTFGTTRLSPAYDRHPQKVTRYADSFLGVAGSAAHQLVLENVLARTPDLDFHGKSAIYESFRRLHPVLKEEAFLNPKEEDDDPYESSQMTVMVANPAGIFAVYSMREVFEFDRFWAIGSGRDFALGAMFSLYPATKAAAAIARAGVVAGAEFDTGTSEPVTLYEVKLRKRAKGDAAR
jgi:ATP-dependent protease HslVU (ClpYQ) peptidase subunit